MVDQKRDLSAQQLLEVIAPPLNFRKPCHDLRLLSD